MRRLEMHQEGTKMNDHRRLAATGLLATAIEWMCGTLLISGLFLSWAAAAQEQSKPTDPSEHSAPSEPAEEPNPPEATAQPAQAETPQQAGTPEDKETEEAESAEERGQELLDQAVRVKLSARNMKDLERVVELCEQALSQGLDEGNTQFAKSLLSSTLYEHGARIAEAIFGQTPPDRRWPLLRQFALRDLEKSLQYDLQQGETHLLIARLQALPGGDRARGRKAAEAAVRLLTEDDRLRSQALVVRAGLTDEAKQRSSDYDEAVRLDPRNVDAWRQRGIFQLGQGQGEKAIEDFLELLKLAPDDVVALQALATALSRLQRLDEALKYVNKAIELQPDSPLGYKLRAQIQAGRKDTKAALGDLSRAVDLQPSDVGALTMRARLWQEEGKLDFARADLDRVLDLKPGFPQAMLLRSLLSAREHKFDLAIDDLQQLLKQDPSNVELRLQIAAYYYDDQRPRKAIELCAAVLDDDQDNWLALRLRGDASLLIGKHAQAVADYEAAHKLRPDDSGILNNWAWVLATSPRDQVRDGKRAIELATRACELTDFKAPHILSTLAAGYAETGDFETATQWSDKAVALARQEVEAGEQEPETAPRLKEQLEQLKQELASYKQKKPWRELIEKKDKTQPTVTAVDDSDLDLAAPGAEPPGEDQAKKSTPEAKRPPQEKEPKAPDADDGQETEKPAPDPDEQPDPDERPVPGLPANR